MNRTIMISKACCVFSFFLYLADAFLLDRPSLAGWWLGWSALWLVVAVNEKVNLLAAKDMTR